MYIPLFRHYIIFYIYAYVHYRTFRHIYFILCNLDSSAEYPLFLWRCIHISLYCLVHDRIGALHNVQWKNLNSRMDDLKRRILWILWTWWSTDRANDVLRTMNFHSNKRQNRTFCCALFSFERVSVCAWAWLFCALLKEYVGL